MILPGFADFRGILPAGACHVRFDAESLRAEPERKSANGKAAPQGGRATKKRAPFGARFFLVHFQGLSRLRRVAAVCAPWGPPAALRRCPALRLAVSATSGARLRAPWAR